MTPAPPSPINRWLVGIISVVCLSCGVLVGLFSTGENLWCGSFIRVGVLMGAFWLTLPGRGRTAAWERVNPAWILAVAVGLLIVVRRPQVLFPIVGALFVLTAASSWLGGRRPPDSRS